MAEETSNGVQYLRFTDENGEMYPDWEQKTLGEVSMFHMGFTPPTGDKSLWEGDNHWLSIKGLGTTKYLTKGSKFVSEKAVEKKKVFPANTVLMSFKLSIGKLGITKTEMYSNEAICGFKTELSNEYLYYALQNVDFSLIGEQAVKGKTLNSKSLKLIPLQIPDSVEQEKIGELFSLFDARIEATAERVTLLKEQKKGYAQRIFSRELRFVKPDGTAYPEWEEKTLGETLKTGFSGGTPKSSEKRYYGGHIPFLSVTDITNQGKYIEKTNKNLTQDGLDNSTAKVVEVGSLIYAMYASVGKMCINKIELVTSQAMYAMTFKDGFDTDYMMYTIDDFNNKKLFKHIRKGTQSNINAQVLKSFDLAIPSSLQEQQQIGGFLSTLDEEIERTEQQLEHYKQEKKAYAQRMFA